MSKRRNIAILAAFALAIVTVEVVNFAFVSWKAILSAPLIFMLITPVGRRKVLGVDLLQWCLNCGHKIKPYHDRWKHFDGKIKTELCMHKGCECYYPQYAHILLNSLS